MSSTTRVLMGKRPQVRILRIPCVVASLLLCERAERSLVKANLSHLDGDPELLQAAWW